MGHVLKTTAARLSVSSALHGGNPGTRRAARWSAGSLVLALVLAGCTAGKEAIDVDPSATSTGQPGVGAGLAPKDLDPSMLPFYEQSVAWESCNDDHLCATIDIPVDWADASAGKASLAVERTQASGTKQGSLLINPGGPGASGIDFLDAAVSVISPEVQEAYDVVGFDPRGVGRSSPVTCLDDAGKDQLLSSDFDMSTDAGRAAFQAAWTAFGAACQSNTGAMLEHVDTGSAARDMDLLRALLGDEKLTYLGYSYGTQLGGTYAALFPERVGRLVLDGAVDYTLEADELSAGQAEGFERALRAYVTDCMAGARCPLTGSVDDGLKQIRELTERAFTDPLPTQDAGRVLTRNLAFYGIAITLYADESWPVLTQALAMALQRNDGSGLLSLADAYNSRDFDGGFEDNSTEAFTAIGCADGRAPADLAHMQAERDKILAVAPTLGESFAWNALVCAGWPTPAKPFTADPSAPGAAPIVVIGTTNDPATPYEWSQSLAKTLESGVLLSWEGEGHTAYGRSNECIAGAVDAYLLDGTVPQDGLVC